VLEKKDTQLKRLVETSAAPGHLDQMRGGNIKGVVFDVVKRDQEEGTYNIDCLCYAPPHINPKKVDVAMRKVLIDMFGPAPPDFIELIYVGADNMSLEVQIDGSPKPIVCESFGFSILHPKSLYWSLDTVRDTVFKRFFVHYEG